jgi:2-haloacid dehalogenase
VTDPAAGPVTKAEIDTVVFDLGGVLINWDPRVAFHDTLPDHEVDPFLAEIDFYTLNRGIDAGRALADVESEVDRLFPHRAGVLAAYHRNFPRTLTGEIPGTADVLRELDAAGLRLLALTNWSGQTFPHARELFPVLGLFEGIVVSGDERVIKPDRRIFEVLFERYDVEPSRAAYIDDSAANVAAAGELGLHAVQFVDVGRLRAELAALGLPVSPLP